jgi:hypothetical protein
VHMTLERWRHLTEWPLTAAAAVFLFAYAWEVVGDLHGPPLVAAETEIDMRAATRGQIRELSKQVTELKALLEQRSA